MGRSGLRVSTLTLGTRGWGRDIDPHTAEDLLTAYRSAGGTTLDTAYAYDDGVSEELVGALLATARRDELMLCTKSGFECGAWEGGHPDTSRGGLLRRLDTSLSRLRTDHVDLWLVDAWNGVIPLAETLSALEYAVQSGRTRYVGVGGYLGWQLALAATTLQAARVPVVACGTTYNLLERWAEQDVIDAADYLGCGVIAWSPLAGGVLSGKYRRGIPAQSRAAAGGTVRLLHEGNGPVVEALTTAAEGLGVSATEVALAWTRERTGIASITVGCRTTVQLATALRSDRLSVPREVAEALDEVSA